MLERTPTTKAQALLDKFGKALEAGDIDSAVNCFQADCYWRDLVTFTWNLKTMEGQDQIRDMLQATLASTKPAGWAVAKGEEASEDGGVITAWITFETSVARGFGLVRFKGDLIWTLLTTMAELKGHEEKAGFTRPLGAKHGHGKGRKTWREERDDEIAELGHTKQPYVVIIGGGQGGIALGARLKQLGVPTIIVEKNERPGDSWRKRYKSLCLHDPVWYDHLPYIDFPKNWPVFAPKDKIGDWLEMYTKVMELNYWSSTTAKSAKYDEKAKEWTIVVERGGKQIVLKPKQLVLATGMSGKANWPKYKGQDIFKGEQQHSSTHPGPDKYRGKKVVVIGSNNSAHDICAALWEGGADVTMVQRSSTHIVKSDTLMDIGLGALYSEQAVENGMTTGKADMIFASLPYRILHEFQIPLYRQMKERDAKFYDDLERAGFMLDWGDDGSGLFMKYLRRGSGYYIDVGACDLVIDGSIKLKSGPGAAVQELTETSVKFVDGTELPADLVIYATGYGSMNGWAADLISQEVADKVGKVWGLGSATTKDPGPWEGEQRNMWKPTQQEALWFHGGNLHQSRHYSQYLSLQLKARQVGLPTPVYGLQEVYHKS
ncbi:NAD(P)/FAD-dependent oxidoreductase [Mesorhizobium sp. CA18]|uniref:NAD(P)/FAD-dependent oxidoreductase n=1 Tax=unclassified Mesorhizobium TaxID=325217 RepID=UPI001CCEE77C|nr:MULTISPECIES: NAD(P)/FAD-dependent oxidoreductase [unclassified Mesorhizobium]MBZ9732471.1 NAD(P)/FAD-dependent oxidoreductase [Mesorhizobium sp. CA9]MBZ9823910.1 NAD(P)/FAD-dependent oxidoreductase [Mesorhizobium sp. CA18]MBZ9830138.1 NAD(P)/FAD-dependent oxidoreductase [Mesorhizobium sp. CA2]MBZ9835764.1 NAD(P)/FAD-dependent oxidoreductase [Mesorhizobium sp. CA3]MBZ9875552.1 NAD(P)/FAD-dependent oxidoreductase [Mesorhizobium sp. Ca11]